MVYSCLVEGGASRGYYRVSGNDESGSGGGDKWDLWNTGTRLRGANIWLALTDDEMYADAMGSGHVGPPFVQSDFATLAAWGCNYVNISHPGLFTVEAPYLLDEAAQNSLDNLLTMIETADMFAVITFRTGPGRSEYTFHRAHAGDWFPPEYLIETVLDTPAVQDAWADMWRHTADRYKDHPVVAAYDLMCEPNAPDALYSLWDEAADYYPAHAGEEHDWNAILPPLVSAIRDVDPDTPIIVGGNNYSQVVWLPYLELAADPRVVYAVHQYYPDAYTNQLYEDSPALPVTYPGMIEEEPFNLATLQGVMSIVDQFKSDHGVPVVANEWGLIRYEPNAETFLADMTGLFESSGVNHAIWDWTSGFHSALPDLWDGFNFRHGQDPENHTDVATSDFIEALKANWALNTVRPSNFSGGGTQPPPPQTRLERFSSINHFMYQIQGLEEPGAVDALAATHYDLVVLEPTNTFVGEETFDTAGMVAALKASPDSRGGSKLVIAYIDVGQAEDYRTYWQPEWVPPTVTERGEPDFMITIDPDGWSGNYPVAYWDQRWIDLMIDDPDSVLNQIIDAGFEGIYMDWVEAYDDEYVIAAAADDGVSAADEMVAFIGHLRAVAQARDPDFLVIQQNAPFLIEEAAGLADAIDGLSMEDTWFLGQADVDWGDPLGGDFPQEAEGYTTELLLEAYTLYQAAGLPVWTVDYCLEVSNAVHVYNESSTRGLLPVVTQTSLMQLTETPPPWY
jgi:cysteinyl-tRNA synthetase